MKPDVRRDAQQAMFDARNRIMAARQLQDASRQGIRNAMDRRIGSLQSVVTPEERRLAQALPSPTASGQVPQMMREISRGTAPLMNGKNSQFNPDTDVTPSGRAKMGIYKALRNAMMNQGLIDR